MKKQPWIDSQKTDLTFIIAPSWVALLLAYLFSWNPFCQVETPLWAWVVFILFLDVAHVHSTLFKTYFDAKSFARHRTLYLAVPALSYGVFVLLYWQAGSIFFWRILAYTAVFHFIRQQYGFVRLYNRQETQARWLTRFDEWVIYGATLAPILHWHVNSPRNFVWFVENDFYLFPSTRLQELLLVIYALLALSYIIKEGYCIVRGFLNLPRILLISGTFLTWYFGIMYFNNDLIFTILNVVVHGIPYIWLVWIDIQKRKPFVGGLSKRLFSPKGLIFFLGSICGMAYLEEGLWDALQWREYPSLFSWLYGLPSHFADWELALLIPLLALPQITHYILDGFIWKRGFDGVVSKELPLLPD